MIKNILIGASVLALSAGVANAQSVNPRAMGSQSAVSVSTTTNVPVQGAGEAAAVRGADDNLSSTANVSTARQAVMDANNDTATGAHASLYNANIQGVGGVATYNTTGDKAAIDTKGDDNNAQIDQTASTAGWGVVKQGGDYNRALIEQKNTGGTAATQNAASIQQVASNSANGLANSNNAEIHQQVYPSSLNTAANQAAIAQGGRSADGGVGAAGANNQARIDQIGISNGNMVNDATIAQLASNNRAYIGQGQTNVNYSVGNHATVQQASNGDARVDQYGIGDRALVNQGQVSGFAKADVVQAYAYNTNNLASINQGGASAIELTGYVDQNGSNNSAFVDQSGDVTKAYAEIFQNGSSNVGVVSQTGAGGMANADGQIAQYGNGNFGSIRQ